MDGPGRDASRSRSPDSARTRRRHTPRAIVEQMNDISGTITELMHENVYLRTKLLNAKSPHWKRIFLGLYDVDLLFCQWACLVKQKRIEQLSDHHHKTVTEMQEVHDNALQDAHDHHRARHTALELQHEAEKAEKLTTLQKLEVANKQIQRLIKYFNIVNETARNASEEHVGMTDEDAAMVRESYCLKVANNSDKEGEEAEVTDPNLINEVVVERLHQLLAEVDGRYVKPLNTMLPQRATALGNRSGGSEAGSASGVGRTLNGMPPPKSNGFGWNYKSLQTTPLLGGRIDTTVGSSQQPPMFTGIHALAPLSVRTTPIQLSRASSRGMISNSSIAASSLNGYPGQFSGSEKFEDNCKGEDEE